MLQAAASSVLAHMHLELEVQAGLLELPVHEGNHVHRKLVLAHVLSVLKKKKERSERTAMLLSMITVHTCMYQSACWSTSVQTSSAGPMRLSHVHNREEWGGRESMRKHRAVGGGPTKKAINPVTLYKMVLRTRV